MVSELKRDIVPSLQLLPYAREVQAWLIDFLSAATHKKKPPEDYILNLDRRSGIFVDAHDINQAIDFISIIHADQGYMEPWHLEDKLILAYNPSLPREAVRIADDFSAFEQSRDRLTNYYQKPQTPLVMGLAGLYKQTQHQEVSVFEIDFSNMRGTNEHNEKIIKAAYPGLSARDVSTYAMELTDQYAFLVSAAVLKSIEDRINIDRPIPVTLVPLRTGGDEIRIVAINMSDTEAQKILPAIHDEIESTTAMLGLHDHPHAKRPLDNLSNGFGAAGTTFSLEIDGQFNDAIARADKRIGDNKVTIGRSRAEDSPFAALKPPDFDLENIYTDSKAASRYLDHLHETMAMLRQKLDTGVQHRTSAAQIEAITERQRLTHIPGKDEIQKMLLYSYLESLEQKNIDLTEEQEKVLKIKVLKFPQNDPSSGTLSSRDFPAMAGVALQVVQNVNNITKQDAHLWTVGASFHNLAGLNETLGHGYSNLVLHEQAAIIRESFHKTGLSDKHFQIAHMGNGDFSIVIQPIYIEDDKSIRRITQQDMSKVAAEIEKGIEKLNSTPIATFLKKHGVNPPDHLPTHFADIENPRDEKLAGLRVSVSAKSYEPDKTLNTNEHRQGGAVKQFISEHLMETATYNKVRWGREHVRKPDFSPGMDF